MNVIILEDATTKIKPAIEAFKNSIQNIQSNPDNTSSILCSLKLISVGDRVDEVKTVLRRTLGLGINDTNDLIGSTPCEIVSQLPASEITLIKDDLIKAGATVDIL